MEISDSNYYSLFVIIRITNTKKHRPRYLLNLSDFHHISASATVTPTIQILYIRDEQSI
jgi:hypothetical protein